MARKAARGNARLQSRKATRRSEEANCTTGVVGLLVLAPADISNEGGVVVNNPLTTGDDGGVVAVVF
ncbi:MAG: hypothetical protein OSA84_01245 [Akkermansiaceae bacterium]|nr:hypothetical protein [Akkermansiaceae bacterium]